jgi:hypothetical protein
VTRRFGKNLPNFFEKVAKTVAKPKNVETSSSKINYENRNHKHQTHSKIAKTIHIPPPQKFAWAFKK